MITIKRPMWRVAAGSAAAVSIAVMTSCTDGGAVPTGASGSVVTIDLVSAQVSTVGAARLSVLAYFRNRSGTAVPIDSASMTVSDTGLTSLRLPIDIAPCIAQAAPVTGVPGCPLRLSIRLLGRTGGLAESREVGPLSAVPGGAVRPDALPPLRLAATMALADSVAAYYRNAGTQLTASISEASGAALMNRTIRWRSDAPSVVAVDSLTGVVRNVGVGLATITARLFEDTTITASVMLTGVSGRRRISAGSHACDIFAVGPGSVPVCWGSNASGQLGDNSVTNRPQFVGLFNNPPIHSVTAGANHSCGVLATLVLACWGANGAGQLGTGMTTPSAVPALVDGAGRFFEVVAGNQFSCALSVDNRAVCWGLNSDGQLGDGTNTNSAKPVAVRGGQRFVALSAGGAHVCGTTSSGAVYCWGANAAGQLGDNSTTPRTEPTLINGSYAVGSVSAGGQHTCALINTGEALCWGANANGQLGDETTQPRLVPTPVRTPMRFQQISAGVAHSCAAQRTVATGACWGSNASGQLGIGSAVPQVTMPTLIANASSTGAPVTFFAVYAGAGFSCGLDLRTPTYRTWCWGANTAGQLGNGTFTSTIAPRTAVQ